MRLLAKTEPRGNVASTDAILLCRFLKTREEASFAALVHRHGPMVFGVCTRLLKHNQDAEDAFQTTFLVLAQKAGAIARPEQLSCWLHGVARRIALTIARKRQRLEPITTEPVAIKGNEPDAELLGHIDDAIARLPSCYRIVFLLCHGEGLTTRKAAERLDLPPGTVFSRLNRSRLLLRQSLRRKGIPHASTITLGLLGTTVSTSLASSTTAAIMSNSIPLALTLLATGATTSMFLAKFLLPAFIVSVISFSTLGVATIYGQKSRDGSTTQGKKETEQKKLTDLEQINQKLLMENLELKRDVANLQKDLKKQEHTFKLLTAESKVKQLTNEIETKVNNETNKKNPQNKGAEIDVNVRRMEQDELRLRAELEAKRRMEDERAAMAKAEEQRKEQEVRTEQRKMEKLKMLKVAMATLQEEVQSLQVSVKDGRDKGELQVNQKRLDMRIKLLIEAEERLLRAQFGLEDDRR